GARQPRGPRALPRPEGARGVKDLKKATGLSAELSATARLDPTRPVRRHGRARPDHPRVRPPRVLHLPNLQAFRRLMHRNSWMPGPRPGMTACGGAPLFPQIAARSQLATFLAVPLRLRGSSP